MKSSRSKSDHSAGDAKQKNGGQAKRKKRRAPGDIGNLVNVAPAVVETGKPQTQITRPITRTFHAQLMANAQAAANKNIKKPQAEASNGENHEEETPKRRTKKPSKTLTSVLTARSKVACGITTKPKGPIVNIDESDDICNPELLISNHQRLPG